MTFQIPSEDYWFIERLAIQVRQLIVSPRVDKSLHPSLLRILFALQRLPNLVDETNISLSVCDAEPRPFFTSEYYSLAISSDGVHFTHFTEDGHTEFRANYFQGCHDCIDGFAVLEGESKREALLEHMEAFELQASEGLVLLEDHSCGVEIDIPPLHLLKA